MLQVERCSPVLYLGHECKPCKNCWTNQDAIFWGGRQTPVGPRNHALDEGLNPPTERSLGTRQHLSNGCVQSSHPPDVTNSMQQGHHTLVSDDTGCGYGYCSNLLLGRVAACTVKAAYSRHQTFTVTICQSECGSVCRSSALWKNGGSNPDATRHGRLDGSMDEAGSEVWGSVNVKE